MPVDIKHIRASRTRYRKAFLPGCGQWKRTFSPPLSNLTDEPEPSTSLQPAAIELPARYRAIIGATWEARCRRRSGSA